MDRKVDVVVPCGAVERSKVVRTRSPKASPGGGGSRNSMDKKYVKIWNYIWKYNWLHYFYTFSHTCIFFLLPLALLWLFPPLLFHLSILSEVWLLNISILPSIKQLCLMYILSIPPLCFLVVSPNLRGHRVAVVAQGPQQFPLQRQRGAFLGWQRGARKLQEPLPVSPEPPKHMSI